MNRNPMSALRPSICCVTIRFVLQAILCMPALSIRLHFQSCVCPWVGEWVLCCSGEASGLQCLKLERYAWWRRGKGVEQQLGSFASFSAEYYVNQWRPPLVRNIRTLAYPSSGTGCAGSFILISSILKAVVKLKCNQWKLNVYICIIYNKYNV